MMVSSGNTRPWNQWIVQFGIKKGHYKNLGWSISQNSYQVQMSIMRGLEEGFQGFQNIRVIGGPPKWYQVMRSPKLVPNNQNPPYLRSYGHFQMTIFDQTVNITIIFSVYSIYITYLFRPVNSTDVWLFLDWNTRPWNLWIVQFGLLAILNLCKLGPLEGVTFGKLLIWCSVRSNEPVKAKKLSVAICSRYFIIWLDYILVA